jgi:integrase
MNATLRKRDKVGNPSSGTNGGSKGAELAACGNGNGKMRSGSDKQMNSPAKLAHGAPWRDPALEAERGRARSGQVDGDAPRAMVDAHENHEPREAGCLSHYEPEYAQAIELLRSTGATLLTAVRRYVEAVKILDSDKVVEAARDFARRNSHHRQARKVHRVGEELVHQIFTPTELMRLLAAAPGWFRPVLAMQAFAGLRCGELLRLDWEQVKLDRGHIEVASDRGKSATKRLAPMPPNLVRWLTDTAKSPCKVFPYSRANFDEIHARTAMAAEIAWQDEALRHSFLAYRVALTSDVPRVALESGTSAGMIFKRYRALVSEMDARQWFTIAP